MRSWSFSWYLEHTVVVTPAEYEAFMWLPDIPGMYYPVKFGTSVSQLVAMTQGRVVMNTVFISGRIILTLWNAAWPGHCLCRRNPGVSLRPAGIVPRHFTYLHSGHHAPWLSRRSLSYFYYYCICFWIAIKQHSINNSDVRTGTGFQGWVNAEDSSFISVCIVSIVIFWRRLYITGINHTSISRSYSRRVLNMCRLLLL